MDTPTHSPSEVVLIDLSSLAHPIWHMSQSDPDPNKTCQQVVARVRALASGRRHVAICCDSGRSFRKDIAATYKANRPESDASLQHQITLACEQLQADGFPVWSVKGFEADDLIASAVTQVLATPELSALVVSADKDLLQLVGPRVKQMRPDSGNVLDAEQVWVKFAVKPEQMRDYLTMVGDASDNIKGAAGIGPKKASDLLAAYGSLDAVYAGLREHPSTFKPAMATALKEFEPRRAETCALITLNTDVSIPFDELDNERVPREATDYGTDLKEDEMETEVAQEAGPVAVVERPAPVVMPAQKPTVVDAPAKFSELATPAGLVPSRYELTLDPVTLPQAIRIAKDLWESRMFSSYGTPQAVLSTIMLGRELGLPAMASLRQIHNVEGKHALSADLMVALILKSGMAEYFEPVEFDAQHAIWVTKRANGRQEVRIEHTIEMAQTAGLVKPNGNWVKVPIDMLNARAKSRLARLVYPDIVGGLYTPDELAAA